MGSAVDAVAAVFTAGISTLATKALDKPSIPKPATPATPPQSQSSKLPDAGSVAGDMTGTGQAGGSPGVAQTMLTGTGGVDPSTLTLGKNTLLGT